MTFDTGDVPLFESARVIIVLWVMAFETTIMSWQVMPLLYRLQVEETTLFEVGIDR